MTDPTLNLVTMLLQALVLIFLLAGVWLVLLGWKGKWRKFIIVAVAGLVISVLFAGPPLLSSSEGILANWDMAFMLGGSAILIVELSLAVILGCIARFINLQKIKRVISK